MGRSKDEIVIDLITNILREEGRADIMPGQVLRNVAIDAQASELENLYNLLDATATAQSISNANFMSQQDLDNLLSNFGIKRRGSQKATGQVTFWTKNIPSQTIRIPKDTLLGTNIQRGASSEVKFLTRFDAVFEPSIASTYWNTVTGQWEITVDVIAQNGGSDANIGAYSISTVQNINIAFQVTNYNPTVGGSDQESNQDFANRALGILLGSNAGTRTGYLGTASQQDDISDALIVGPGETLMTRDGGFGGKVDIWVMPLAGVGYTTIGPSSDASLSFSWDDSTEASNAYRFDFPQKPVDVGGSLTITAASSPSGVSTALLFERRNATSGTQYALPGAWHYEMFKATDLDTGGSIYANDYILWNPGEMEYLRKVDPNANYAPVATGNQMTVAITYSYTSAVSNLQSILDDSNIKILTADVLAKEAEKIYIDVYMDVELLPEYKTTATTQQETIGLVELAIANQINGTTLGNQVQESDIVTAAHNVAGVDNVVINSVTLTKTRPAVLDIAAESIVDDDALSNQYFVASNIQVNSI
jgi:hypothetical protein